MSADFSSSLTITRSKLTKKRSLREKLFFRHHENKPKLQKAKSCDRKSKNRWKSLNLRNYSSSVRKHQRQPSKLGIFIQETFEKLTHLNSPSSSRSLSDPTMAETFTIMEKSHWKPSLEIIFEDPQLLSALIKFMERSYNEESILFLQSVRKLNANIQRKEQHIDIQQEIFSIFQTYIAPTAEYQINLSYACFLNTTKLCQPQLISTYSTNEAMRIFDHAVAEIRHLMCTSVMNLFFDSDEFQIIAQKRNIYNNTISGNVSPLSQPVMAPILLSMSRSSMVGDSNVSALTDNGDEAASMDDEFDNDELVFIDAAYLKSFHI